MVRSDEEDRERRIRKLLKDEEKIRRKNEEQERRLKELTEIRRNQEQRIAELKKKCEEASQTDLDPHKKAK